MTNALNKALDDLNEANADAEDTADELSRVRDELCELVAALCRSIQSDEKSINEHPEDRAINTVMGAYVRWMKSQLKRIEDRAAGKIIEKYNIQFE